MGNRKRLLEQSLQPKTASVASTSGGGRVCRGVGNGYWCWSGSKGKSIWIPGGGGGKGSDRPPKGDSKDRTASCKKGGVKHFQAPTGKGAGKGKSDARAEPIGPREMGLDIVSPRHGDKVSASLPGDDRCPPGAGSGAKCDDNMVVCDPRYDDTGVIPFLLLENAEVSTAVQSGRFTLRKLWSFAEAVLGGPPRDSARQMLEQRVAVCVICGEASHTGVACSSCTELAWCCRCGYAGHTPGACWRKSAVPSDALANAAEQCRLVGPSPMPHCNSSPSSDHAQALRDEGDALRLLVSTEAFAKLPDGRQDSDRRRITEIEAKLAVVEPTKPDLDKCVSLPTVTDTLLAKSENVLRERHRVVASGLQAQRFLQVLQEGLRRHVDNAAAEARQQREVHRRLQVWRRKAEEQESSGSQHSASVASYAGGANTEIPKVDDTTLCLPASSPAPPSKQQKTSAAQRAIDEAEQHVRQQAPADGLHMAFDH